MITNLVVQSIDPSESTASKTIPNINPNATFEQLDSFARKLNGLTTHTYVDSVRVQKESVNEHLAE